MSIIKSVPCGWFWEKIIEVYTHERFVNELLILKEIFSNKVTLLNWWAIFCYSYENKWLDWLNLRYPTDIDIAIEWTLDQIMDILSDNNIDANIHKSWLSLWWLKYLEDFIIANIEWSKIAILNKSTIKKENNDQFSIDFSSEIFQKIWSEHFLVHIAWLEYLKAVKMFQLRPSPKSDYIDIYIIHRLMQDYPNLFDQELYNKILKECLTITN